jgi:hypothetical protein
MGTGLRINMKQLLFVLFVLLTLLVTAAIVIHAATPNLFHALALRPEIFNHR